jgi:hypothetical protein
MPGWSFPISEQIATNCLAFDEPSNTLWFATNTGEIRTLRLMDGREVLAGSGYQSPVGLVLDSNGLGLTVVEAAGLVWDVARANATRTSALQKADLGQALVGAAPRLDLAEVTILTAGGKLVALNKQNGAVETLIDGFSQPLGVLLRCNF